MQLQNIRTRVRERLGLSTNDTNITDAILTQIINAANRKLAMMQDWPWLVTVDATWTATVAGTTAYTPATNWRKTLYIVSDTNQLLQYKQQHDVVRYAGNNGYPLFYTVRNGSILLYPTPDAVYTISHVYIAEVAALSGDTDRPEIASADAEQWAVDALIELTCLLTAQRLRDAEMILVFEGEFARTMAALNDEVRKSRGMPTPKHRLDIGWQ